MQPGTYDACAKEVQKKQRCTSDFVIVVIIDKITLIYQLAAATYLTPILSAPKLYEPWISKDGIEANTETIRRVEEEKRGERLPDKVPCSPSSLFSGSYTAFCKRR